MKRGYCQIPLPDIKLSIISLTLKNMNKNTHKKIYLPHLDDFLLELKVNNKSDETIYNYKRDLEVFENFLQEIGSEFENINKKTILNYKAYLSSIDRTTPKGKGGKKLSPVSINRMLSSLRSYLNFLVKIDYKVPVTSSSIELVKTEKKIPKIGEFEQILKLLEAPMKLEKDPKIALRNRAILETMFATGVRISELINIKISDIDKEGKIYIKGKGKKERFVYLTERAKKYLNDYLKIRKDPSPFLFVPFKGKSVKEKLKKISTNYIQYKIKRYREILGLNIPITPHGLRRAFATFLAESGANPAAIQILLGHESLSTTTRYVRPSDRYAEKEFKKYHPLKE
jgi:integrase/recombinase XerD